MRNTYNSVVFQAQTQRVNRTTIRKPCRVWGLSLSGVSFVSHLLPTWILASVSIGFVTIAVDNTHNMRIDIIVQSAHVYVAWWEDKCSLLSKYCYRGWLNINWVTERQHCTTDQPWYSQLFLSRTQAQLTNLFQNDRAPFSVGCWKPYLHWILFPQIESI